MVPRDKQFESKQFLFAWQVVPYWSRGQAAVEMKASKDSPKKEVGFISLSSCSPGTSYEQILTPCIALVGAQTDSTKDQFQLLWKTIDKSNVTCTPLGQCAAIRKQPDWCDEGFLPHQRYSSGPQGCGQGCKGSWGCGMSHNLPTWGIVAIGNLDETTLQSGEDHRA
jgi:hypothetical protein